VRGVVDVLERSVTHWATYAKDAAQLASHGNLNAGEWAKRYAVLWQSLAEDVGKLTKLAFPGAPQRGPAGGKKKPPKRS
jgi:hypothetical protein